MVTTMYAEDEDEVGMRMMITLPFAPSGLRTSNSGRSGARVIHSNALDHWILQEFCCRGPHLRQRIQAIMHKLSQGLNIRHQRNVWPHSSR
mmetsp:Transcript_87885/g.151766  ORF Transcript_87885/g.151766 Transcript_87885/m.151766 type:complete len:91 (+) Transcript_87885:3-275(+)